VFRRDIEEAKANIPSKVNKKGNYFEMKVNDLENTVLSPYYYDIHKQIEGVVLVVLMESGFNNRITKLKNIIKQKQLVGDMAISRRTLNPAVISYLKKTLEDNYGYSLSGD